MSDNVSDHFQFFFSSELFAKRLKNEVPTALEILTSIVGIVNSFGTIGYLDLEVHVQKLTIYRSWVPISKGGMS